VRKGAWANGHHEKAGALLDEAKALGRELRDKRLISDLCMQQGHMLLEGGDLAATRRCYEEGLALRREIEDRWAIAWALLEVGHVVWLQGEPAVTQSHAQGALALFQALGDKDGLLAGLESLAAAALVQKREERTARLMGAVEALRDALKLCGPDSWRRPKARMRDAVRAASLKEALAAAWAEGRAMSLEEAVRYALEDQHPA
jgi:hypothetical protein